MGAPPEATPGLRDHPAGDEEFARLRDELWGGAGDGRPIERAFGKGQVFWGQPLTAVLERLGTAARRRGVVALRRRARHLDPPDDRRGRRLLPREPEDGRTSGWSARSASAAAGPSCGTRRAGTIAPAAVYECEAGRVRVPVELDPFGSVFVVLRSPAPAETPTALARDGEVVLARPALPEGRDARGTRASSNDFTVTLWAKPESNVMLSTDNFMEGVNDPWTDQYAIYPPSGATSTARPPDVRPRRRAERGGGVGALLREAGVRPGGARAPLGLDPRRARVPGGRPGGLGRRRARPARGERKNGEVHPGVGPAYLSDGASYYNGDMTEPVVHAGALGEAEIEGAGALVPRTAGRVEQGRRAGGRRRRRRRCGSGGTGPTGSPRAPAGLDASWSADLPDAVAVTGPWRVVLPAGEREPRRASSSASSPRCTGTRSRASATSPAPRPTGRSSRSRVTRRQAGSSSWTSATSRSWRRSC